MSETELALCYFFTTLLALWAHLLGHDGIFYFFAALCFYYAALIITPYVSWYSAVYEAELSFFDNTWILFALVLILALVLFLLHWSGRL